MSLIQALKSSLIIMNELLKHSVTCYVIRMSQNVMYVSLVYL